MPLAGNENGIDSTLIEPSHWITIAKCLREHLKRSEVVGCVVCHGTDTLHYTAAALTYLLPSVKKPVILTGSSLGWNIKYTDAFHNICDGILSANISGLKGIYVTFNRKLFAGTRLRKASYPEKGNFDVFEAVNSPLIGILNFRTWGSWNRFDPLINTAIVPINTRILRGDRVRRFKEKLKVDVIWCHPSMCAERLPERDSVAGVVLACYGSGGVPLGMDDSTRRRDLLQKLGAYLRAGGIVLATSQARMSVDEDETYEAYEDFKALAKETGRIIFAGDLPIEEAIVLLLIALNTCKTPEKIRDAVRELNRQAISIEQLRSSTSHFLMTVRPFFRFLLESDFRRILFPHYSKAEKGEVTLAFDHILDQAMQIEEGKLKYFSYPFNFSLGADVPTASIQRRPSKDLFREAVPADNRVADAIKSIHSYIEELHNRKPSLIEAADRAFSQLHHLNNALRDFAILSEDDEPLVKSAREPAQTR